MALAWRRRDVDGGYGEPKRAGAEAAGGGAQRAFDDWVVVDPEGLQLQEMEYAGGGASAQQAHSPPHTLVLAGARGLQRSVACVRCKQMRAMDWEAQAELTRIVWLLAQARSVGATRGGFGQPASGDGWGGEEAWPGASVGDAAQAQAQQPQQRAGAERRRPGFSQEDML